MKQSVRLLIGGVALIAALNSQAITVGPFGAHGEGGSRHGQSLTIGPGGSVHELDAFLATAGVDLNGTVPGTSAQLSRHPLPPGLEYSFSAALSTDGSDLTLTYRFVNTTNVPFLDLRFQVLLDAEIDEATNTFFNEYALAAGTLGRGPYDVGPDSWQIDEPGFQNGTLYRGLFEHALANTNAVPQTDPNDVALALGFVLGRLKPGESTAVRILISESGHTRGPFSLTQFDTDPASASTITLSGEAEVREDPFVDVTPLLQLAFGWRLDRPTGALLGTLTLVNPATNTAAFGPPFRLGFQASTNFWYAQPSGTLDNGLSYVDLTPAMRPQLSPLESFDPGMTATVPNIAVFSRDRTAPPNDRFVIWATRLR
jgi:hypothetical protein